MASPDRSVLGLMAGIGSLPALVAEAARARGYAVHTFGFKGMMDDDLAEHSDEIHEFDFCCLGALFGRMEKEGITRAVTIGAITQTSVIGGMPKFDDLALEIWKRLPDRRVDTIMETLVDYLDSRGIKVLPTLDFLTDHLVSADELTDRKPTQKEWEDLRFGIKIAQAIGGIDVGQTVVVKHRAVMAVEAVEGTDAAILRGGELARGDAVVVKVAKPGQDMRYDVPTVGLATLETMKKAGATLLAMEAGKVLMVEKEAMIKAADKAGICLVGVKPEEFEKDG